MWLRETRFNSKGVQFVAISPLRGSLFNCDFIATWRARCRCEFLRLRRCALSPSRKRWVPTCYISDS